MSSVFGLPPPPSPHPPRYGCTKCWIVLFHEKLEDLRCPKCGRKMKWLRDDITVQGMHIGLSGAILLWGNMIALAIRAYFLRRDYEVLGFLAFCVLSALMAYFVFRAAQIYRLAWGKSFMNSRIPERRMVTMSYREAVDRIKAGQPVDMSMTREAPPPMSPFGPPPPMRPGH